MAWRFRKILGLGRGVRASISKTGLGLSTKIPGLPGRVGISPNGQTYASTSIPGTGLNYRQNLAELPRIQKEYERDDNGQLVYFIECADRFVKIGISDNPEARLVELQTGNPFELHLLAVALGGRELEAKLHKRFEKQRVRGEWFYATPYLLRAIARLQDES